MTTPADTLGRRNFLVNRPRIEEHGILGQRWYPTIRITWFPFFQNVHKNAVLVFNVQGFAAEAAGEQAEQETSMQASLTHRRHERKVCTCCKVDKPASEFRAARTSRDGLQHFYVPCKVCAGAPSI